MISLSRWAKLAGLPLLEDANDKQAKLVSTVEGMAVGQIEVRGDKIIVLYDPRMMKNAFTSVEAPVEKLLSKMTEAIQGMIRISPPVYGPAGDESSCRGAWEVVRSGVRTKGAGLGGLLYQIAAGASPTGKLMPDRRDVSAHAQAVWKSKYNKMSDEKKQTNVFDDESDAKTEDPTDDCMVHDYDNSEGPGSNFLNYAYDDFGSKINVRSLNSAHQDFIDELSWSLPENVDVDHLFFKAAENAFFEFKAQ